MRNPKNRITDFLIKLKAHKVSGRLKASMNFPVNSKSIKKVLIILPRNMNLLEEAHSFVQSLKKTYPKWRVELFDVDKLAKTDFNRMLLPKPEILNKLKRADYHFVVDLNENCDQLSSFFALITEAPYRLHLQNNGPSYFNIVYQPQKNGSKDFYKSLLPFLGKLFIKN